MRTRRRGGTGRPGGRHVPRVFGVPVVRVLHEICGDVGTVEGEVGEPGHHTPSQTGEGEYERTANAQRHNACANTLSRTGVCTQTNTVVHSPMINESVV